MTERKDAPVPSVLRGIWHQHGDDAPSSHADGDQYHKHGGGPYNTPQASPAQAEEETDGRG